jgi:hypothetical protein
LLFQNKSWKQYVYTYWIVSSNNNNKEKKGMKSLKIVFALATVIVCSNALANTDMAFQEVLDRNANEYRAKGDHDRRIFFSALLKGLVGLRTATPRDNATNHPIGADITLPRADLYVDAIVNDWTLFHLAVPFNTINVDNDTIHYVTFDETQGLGMYNRLGIFTAFDGLAYRPYKMVDEAYITVGNLHRNPMYFRMGVGRVDFGLYEKNEILVNWTTLFTETQAIFAKVGFMDASGFFGSVYVFRGLSKQNDIDRRRQTDDVDEVDQDGLYDGYPHINNGGVSLGYCMNYGYAGIKFAVDWMYNAIGGVNLFRTLTTSKTTTTVGGNRINLNVYNKEVMGFHVGMKGHYNQFDAKLNFVILGKFADEETMLPGRRPIVWSAGSGVHFKVGYRPSRFGVGVQMTKNLKDAANISGNTNTATGWMKGIVHQTRFHVDWTTEIFKNVTAGLHYAFEHPYNDTLRGGKQPKKTQTALVSLTARVV